jgi:DNA-binding PucR family transcriptional regulator
VTAALFVLTCGARKNLNYPFYFYMDYISDHIVSTFSATHNLDSSLHPAVEILRGYDKEYGTNLMEVLYIYLLNNKSHTVCARKLFIHRSTFQYRLNKIFSMVDVDLDDEETKLNILFSIKLCGMAR